MIVPWKIKIHAVLILLAAGSIAACGGDADERSSSGDNGLRIAVSIPPQSWLVEMVGGSEIRTITLLSPGDSPATYQPADIQISDLMQAEVYFRTGVPFENGRWLQAVQNAGGPRIVDLRDGVPLRDIEHSHGDEYEHGHDTVSESDEGKDPHIWLSPRLLKIQAATIAETLTSLRPQLAGSIEENLADLLKELDEVDAYLRSSFSPHQGKAFYVFHPAWGYLADEYGLRQVAIEIEGKEPSDSELTQFQVMARRDGVTALFVQPQIAGETARAAARMINADLIVLDPMKYELNINLRVVADVISEVLK